MMKGKAIYIIGSVFILSLIFVKCNSIQNEKQMLRKTLPLDGIWEVEQGEMNHLPKIFSHHVSVPGLIDMAEPKFEEVGQKSSLRKAFYYRKVFTLKGKLPGVCLLKIGMAKYGTQVIMNGVVVGEHLPNFTPAFFNVRPYLKAPGIKNELIIRVGAFTDAIPDSVPYGQDFEKKKYIPGIVGSVKLILTNMPFISNVQIAPNLKQKNIRVQIELRNPNKELKEAVLRLRVREKTSGILVTEKKLNISFDSQPGLINETIIPINNLKTWSPEHPFLYELETETAGDALITVFGMRTFRFDKPTGRAMLNGKPYYLRGTNICVYRFFEDSLRGNKPWDEVWVRNLFKTLKSMHWNSFRFAIGFPPDFWYQIADEEGFLIQDEFPLWYASHWPGSITHFELTKEFKEWMRERWNHPSVVIWDACNETWTNETGQAIADVRNLDISHRPWDNSWNLIPGENYMYEAHPYLFQKRGFKLVDLDTYNRIPQDPQALNVFDEPIILNEYGWFWINRNGLPTRLSKQNYLDLFGHIPSPDTLRYTYARTIAALTEFWRSSRTSAGVMHFTALSYSRQEGETSDNFIDINNLTLEPNFKKYVGDAFSPVGLCIDNWSEVYKQPYFEIPTFMQSSKIYAESVRKEISVTVINDFAQDWSGNVSMQVTRRNTVLYKTTKKCEVSGNGMEKVYFQIKVPKPAGKYQLIAMLKGDKIDSVMSVRDFEVIGNNKHEQR